jgi:hypothetical protein
LEEFDKQFVVDEKFYTVSPLLTTSPPVSREWGSKIQFLPTTLFSPTKAPLPTRLIPV